ncbi:TetR/AcrR family transcriptional regulator [Nocardiopsis sp. B62]|uniref:TetR/AcrR family transcriptional regulator n=1 Tax=Nocardiopsis sp. B62 TaxID=2824874 RepID=UPI001B35D2BC|nr:TetR/AcrR family transcriptional regulator [Nocardiopsis sp. B62]MBQ1080646.1 TetR/AcrR family transcriptional regulator [Nocardiopsis sp. B62]
MRKGRGGRRPDPAVDEAIRRATVELLQERGFELTFDEVAERAGVGRTSVFRRYATKEDLLLAAAEQITIDRIEVPDTGSLIGDLTTAVHTVYRVFEEQATQTLARHALVAALREQPGAVIIRGLLDRRLELVTTLLERAVDRGEVPGTERARLVADLLSGVIMARLATDLPLPGEEESAALAAAMATAAAA